MKMCTAVFKWHRNCPGGEHIFLEYKKMVNFPTAVKRMISYGMFKPSKLNK